MRSAKKPVMPVRCVELLVPGLLDAAVDDGLPQWAADIGADVIAG